MLPEEDFQEYPEEDSFERGSFKWKTLPRVSRQMLFRELPEEGTSRASRLFESFQKKDLSENFGKKALSKASRPRLFPELPEERSFESSPRNSFSRASRERLFRELPEKSLF